MDLLELNLTHVEAGVKQSTDGLLSFDQLKYSIVILLYITVRDIVKYAVPLIKTAIQKKIETTIKLE